ncbi:stemmadenine O-acetyltransferase-like [Impatiens glandulifera]|uniref:stemmadenine O-acetyltransferase-like n=1 Tax=Impatiens glandulifera TaxID=253017 RepID=UPI001FB0F2B6|nr:stemmadenine O-acetyltransferase-like [Impatiens glandulifera]
MEITITSIESIKPSSPTPPHLKSFKLSFLDQCAETVYTPIIFFYSSNISSRMEKSRTLKESLSTFLTRCYPLAGRLNENISVDCNDEGVYYSEAEATFPLLDILKEPNTKSMKRLMPPEPKEHGRYDPLFLVQVTFFSCGGLSLGICMSHKLSDASTITTVITGWAESARRSHVSVAPLFLSSSIFPPIDYMSIRQQPTKSEQEEEEKHVVARRYVFDASSVTSLKAIAASEKVPYPSRVEAVSALIWKCTMTGLRSKLDSHKSHGVIWPVNLRARLKPQLSPNTFGNIIIPMVKGNKDVSEGEIELSKLVGIMRRGIVDINEKYNREFRTEELAGVIFSSYTETTNMGEMEFQAHTSWCRFAVYEADFGWGEPVWVTIPYMVKANIVVLLDSRDTGGVEVWVSLTDKDTHMLEQDHDLLEFASLNPPVHYKY